MTSSAPLATLMLTSDPQIGLYRAALARAEDNRAALEASGRSDAVFDDLPVLEGYERETLLFRETIAVANERRPDALIVCGDMLQDWDGDDQASIARELAAELREDVPLHWVAGNHDVAPDTFRPTEPALEHYRHTFGPDRYVADVEAVRVIVMNSTLVHSGEWPDERAAMIAFVEDALASARAAGQVPVVCSHHPWFLREVDVERDDPVTAMELPLQPRRRLLEIAETHGLKTLLTGHLHQHLVRTAGDLTQITTSAIGLPFARDPSGYQLIHVYADRVEHEPYDLPSGPRFHEEARRIWAARQYQPG